MNLTLWANCLQRQLFPATRQLFPANCFPLWKRKLGPLSDHEQEFVRVDTNQGRGWAIFFRWEQPARAGKGVPRFPEEIG